MGAVSEAERARRWPVLLTHRDDLLRTALARGVGREDAEDCVQEALARAALHPGLDLDRAGAFLTTTTVRLAADVHRQRARQARLAARVDGLRPPADDHVEDLADRSLARWLAAQAGTLSGQEQAVLQARVQGGSSREAAAALGISVRAAESSFTRVRSKLQSAWAKVAVVVGALALAGRRQVTAAVQVTAVAATVGLGSVVLLPSTSPVAPPPAVGPAVAQASARPVAAGPVAPRVVALPPKPSAAAPARAAYPAATTATPVASPSPTAAPGQRWHWRSRDPEPADDCDEDGCDDPLPALVLHVFRLLTPP